MFKVGHGSCDICRVKAQQSSSVSLNVDAVKPGEVWPQVLAAACFAEQFLKDSDWVTEGEKSRSFSK